MVRCLLGHTALDSRAQQRLYDGSSFRQARADKRGHETGHRGVAGTSVGSIPDVPTKQVAGQPVLHGETLPQNK